MKKLMSDPWQTEVKNLAVGAAADGTVTQVTPYGAFVRLSDSLEGLFHVSQMNGQKADELVKEGTSYSFEVISIEPELRKISLKLAEAKPAKKAKK